MLKALIGLGNIGKEYECTYHNVGVFVAQQIAQLAKNDGHELAVYEPQGFMNVSGAPVAAWLKMRNLKLEDVVVAHDDSDLAIGSYKLVQGGGSAGHNGIISLTHHLHTEDFWRLRVGIRDPRQIPKAGLPAEAPRAKAGEFVLTPWSKADQEAFKDVAQKAWEELKKK